MTFLADLRKWYLCRKYGVCPIHLTLMSRGGYAQPKWVCCECLRQNVHKHELREKGSELERVRVCRNLRSEEGLNPGVVFPEKD